MNCRNQAYNDINSIVLTIEKNLISIGLINSFMHTDEFTRPPTTLMNAQRRVYSSVCLSMCVKDFKLVL